MQVGHQISQQKKKGRPVGKRNLKDDILTSAINILSEKGDDELSLREISRRLNVTNVALFHYFSNKENLIAALALQGYEKLKGILKETETSSVHETPLNRLGLICQAYVEFAQTDEVFYRCMYHGLIRNFDHYPELQKGNQNCFDIIESAVIDIPGFSEDKLKVRTTSYTVSSLLHGTVTLLKDTRGHDILESKNLTSKTIISSLDQMLAQLISNSGHPLDQNSNIEYI